MRYYHAVRGSGRLAQALGLAREHLAKSLFVGLRVSELVRHGKAQRITTDAPSHTVVLRSVPLGLAQSFQAERLYCRLRGHVSDTVGQADTLPSRCFFGVVA